VTARIASAVVLLPAVAEACATCVGTPYGDRTYNWPYLFLIVLPFVVATVIGGVIARVNGVSLTSLWTRRRHE
jgi:hypothetical protein